MNGKFSDLINGEKPVLVDFYATWCGPCKYQAPILEEVAKEVGDQARIIKIDVDKNQAISTAYQVRGVPTLMIFKQGKVVWRTSGVKQASELVPLIRQYV
jgi:thioredoxin 1